MAFRVPRPCPPTCPLRGYPPPGPFNTWALSASLQQSTSTMPAANYTPHKPALIPGVYHHLRESQIRLLGLHPCRHPSERITTTLHPSTLYDPGAIPLDSLDGERVDYEALSYSWGYAGDTETITVNGQPVQVLTSLAGALRALRYDLRDGGGGVRFLWIDALCINQTDDEEKSGEIQKMFRVYRSAIRTIVWLGVEHRPRGRPSSARLDPGDAGTPPSRFVRKSLGSANRFWNRSREPSPSAGLSRGGGEGVGVEVGVDVDKAETAMVFLNTFDPELVHQRECAGGMAVVCEGLGLLAARPWWERTWVRQEVFAAREVIVRTGDVEMLLATIRTNTNDALHMIESFVAEHRNTVYTEAIDPQNAQKLLDALGRFSSAKPQDATLLASRLERAQLAKQEVWSLDRMLRGSRAFKATDKKDFIYGIVSMTATQTHTSIGTNHNNTTLNAGPPLPPRPLSGSRSPSLLPSRPSSGRTSPSMPPRPISRQDNSDDISLPINYASPLAAVYADAAEYIMKFHQSLDCIFWAYCTEKIDSTFPSWVPNWGDIPRHGELDRVWMAMDHLRMKSFVYFITNLKDPLDPTKEVDPATKRILLGGRQCSRFGAHKSKLFENPSFDVLRDSSGIRLKCTGTVLGTLTEWKRFTSGTKVRMAFGKVFDSYRFRLKNGQVFMNHYLEPVLKDHQQFGFEPSTTVAPADFKYPKLDRRDKRSSHPAATEDLQSWHLATSSVRNTLSYETNRCFAPPSAQNGDLVVLFRGSTLPAVLSPTPYGGNIVTLVGPLISPEYVIEEAQRIWDAGLETQRATKRDKYWPPWPLWGPLKEDLPVEDFIIV